jgi:hypothetical protein
LSRNVRSIKFSPSGAGTDDYYSAELVVDDLAVSYRFKIWRKAPKAVSVLVKENSKLLQLWKVGGTLDVKYYSMQSACPPEWQRTAVRCMTWNDQGRLKGHYLVGLEIIENGEGEGCFHSPFELTLALKIGEHLKVTTLLDPSIKSSPVAGFLPFRSFLLLTQNFPKPLIKTSSPFSRFF